MSNSNNVWPGQFQPEQPIAFVIDQQNQTDQYVDGIAKTITLGPEGEIQSYGIDTGQNFFPNVMESDLIINYEPGSPPANRRMTTVRGQENWPGKIKPDQVVHWEVTPGMVVKGTAIAVEVRPDQTVKSYEIHAGKEGGRVYQEIFPYQIIEAREAEITPAIPE